MQFEDRDTGMVVMVVSSKLQDVIGQAPKKPKIADKGRYGRNTHASVTTDLCDLKARKSMTFEQ